MSLSEEIRSMEAQGMQQEEITRILQNQGISMSDISNAFSASRIKQAVAQESSSATEMSGEELQPSINSPQSAQSMQEDALIGQPQPPQSYGPQTPSQGQYQDYQQYPSYDSYSSGISADTINEIAEQVMLEKLIPLKDKLEQALEFRNIIDTKITYIDERLRKIEKIIDRLQLSVLQKVGEYVTNVEDMKKELQETQKSFRYLLDNPLPKTIKSFAPEKSFTQENHSSEQ